MNENKTTGNSSANDTIQSTIKINTTDTSIKNANTVTDSLTITTGKIGAAEHAKTKNSSGEKNIVDTGEKEKDNSPKNKRENNKQTTSSEKNKRAQKLHLELTTTEACKLFLDGTFYADLTPGFALKAYLKPGVYTLQAITTENNKEYNRIITVKPSDINISSHIKITFR